jgi:hypothetical protein
VYVDRARLIRAKPVEAARFFPPAALHFVYVDVAYP